MVETQTKEDQIISRQKELERLRQPWEENWQEINDHVLPRKSFWDIEAEKGKKPQTKIYDSTATQDLTVMADGFQGYLVSPSLRWFRLRMADKQQQGLPYVADWLEEVEQQLYDIFAATTFYQAFNEYFLDAGSIGTACMYVEDEILLDSILYSPRHQREMYYAEDRTGVIDTAFRKYKISIRQALQTFGDKVHSSLKEKYKTDPYAEVEIIHAVFPRSDRDPTKRNVKNMAWESVYLDNDNKHIMRESGYKHFPYFVWRYRKNTSEIFGRSPAMDAMPDILRTNQIAKSMLTAAQKAVDPPMNVPQEQEGQERLVPGGFNYYSDPTNVITPVANNSNYLAGKDQEEGAKENIHAFFKRDMFMMINNSEREMTAREVGEKVGERAAVFGTTVGRFNAECARPLIERTFAIEYDAGRILPPPPSLLEGGAIEIDFSGPMAQAQKRYHQSQGIAGGLQMIAPIANIFPESLDNADGDELMRQAMDGAGMPQKVIRELPEVQKLRQARAEQQQREKEEQVALAQQEQIAKNADKLNKKIVPGSPLEQIGRAGGR
jgi:hypothetical protein